MLHGHEKLFIVPFKILTIKKIMQSPTNFRVKIDLSQFYDDVRKLSYVFVSENHISHVLHLHQRVKDVFGISRPFYLISDGGVYLPLNEDIRIIKENETVKVCPGSGIPDCLTVWREMGVKCNGKPLPTIQVQKKLDKISELLKPSGNNEIVNPDNSATLPNGDDGENMYESELQCTNIVPGDSDTDTIHKHRTVSKNGISELDNIPSKKRKRVRKRKSRQSPEDANTFTNLSSTPQNEVLEFNSNSISTTKPKHLKFNWEANEEHESPKYEEEKKTQTSEVPELKTLLDLRNSQFPMTFVGQKLKKNDVGIQEYSGMNSRINEQKNNSIIMEQNLVSPENSVEISDFSQINPLNFPVYNQKLMAGDVVAFRTLKMADDYSPTVSGYIVARILSEDTRNSDYTFKILDGQDQLKNPEGKFSLPTDDQMKNIEDFSDEPGIYTMKSMELIEPRLINRIIL